MPQAQPRALKITLPILNPNQVTLKGNTMTNATTSNIETHLSALRSKLKSLGAMEGKGSASRPEAGLRLVDAAYDGFIDEDDAAALYAEYVAGTAASAKNNPLVTCQGDTEQKSAKQQISKFRQFIKVGMLPEVDARDVMRRAVQISKDLEAAGTKTYSRFDAMLNVAREQVKQVDTPLTDEQINACVVKPDSKEKDEVEKLIAAFKAAYKLAETIPMPQTEAARDMYRDAIVEAGGEVPPMTKDEKKAAEAMAFLKSRGMVGVHAIAAE
jgi:hypothetical protein